MYLKSMHIFVGVDIGGSHIGVGIVSSNGYLLKKCDEEIDGSTLTPTNAIKIIVGKTKELIQLQQHESKVKIKVGGVGIGCPGQAKDGYIVAAGNLPNFINVPLVSMIKSKMGTLFVNKDVPVIILNDADAAISAEVWGRYGRSTYADLKNIAMITIGTGVGVGLVINGSLYQGSNGLVEGGHMIVNVTDKNKKCGCGQSGCIEIWSSAKSTVLRMEEADQLKESLAKRMSVSKDSTPSTPTGSPQKASRPSSPTNIITTPTKVKQSPPVVSSQKTIKENSPKGAKSIFQRASKGDIIAQQVINETAEHLAILCINLSRVIDPDVIIIGGGMAKAGKPLLNLIQKYIKSRTWKVLPTIFKLEIAKSLDDAGIIGAALAAQQIVESPGAHSEYIKEQHVAVYRRKKVINRLGIVAASVGVLGCLVGLGITYKQKINNCGFLNAQYTILVANIGLLIYSSTTVDKLNN